MIAVIAAVAVFVGVLSLREGTGPFGLALAHAVQQPFGPRPAADQITRDPEPTSREPVPVPEALLPLEVIFCEGETLVPLALANAKLWVYSPAGNRSIALDVDDTGRAWIARDTLRAATAIVFEVSLPEFSHDSAIPAHESIERLREQATPLRVLVARGKERGIRVIDEKGAGVAGACIEGDMLLAVVTDSRGLARPCLTDPPQHGVHISAPGRRFEYVPVPPDSEQWIVVLRRANRLEIALDTSDDPGGYHVDVRLWPSFVQREFHQSKYVPTPGRAVADTPGSWLCEAERGFSRWQLGFGPERLAVLDQLHDGGQIELELRRFDDLLERRSLELPGDGAVTRVAFRVEPAPPAIELCVLDGTDTPVCGVSVRQAPRRGATIDPSLEQGFPVWAPRAITDAFGVCHLPRPTAPDAVFVLAKDGFAVRVLTCTELVRAGFAVRLEPGHAVDVEVRGRNGEVLTEGWTTGFIDHVRPSAGLGHDTWLDAVGDGPVFHFSGLPAGVVEFRFTHLPLDEVLRHDTRIPNARFLAAESIDELMLGK